MWQSRLLLEGTASRLTAADRGATGTSTWRERDSRGGYKTEVRFGQERREETQMLAERSGIAQRELGERWGSRRGEATGGERGKIYRRQREESKRRGVPDVRPGGYERCTATLEREPKSLWALLSELYRSVPRQRRTRAGDAKGEGRKDGERKNGEIGNRERV